MKKPINQSQLFSKDSKVLLNKTGCSKIYSVASELSESGSCILKVTTTGDKEGFLHSECSLLSKHVVKFFHSYKKNRKTYILMESCDQTLAASIKERQRKERYWGTQKLIDYMKSLLSALKTLHSHNIAHRDIKPDNIFISQDSTLKLGDFGSSERLSRPCYEVHGTFTYIAPELRNNANGAGIDYFKSDVWSLGKSFFEMCTLQLQKDIDEHLSLIHI